VIEWLMQNPSSSVLTKAKDLRKAQAEARAEAYKDATNTIESTMLGMLDGVALTEPVNVLVKQGFIGLRVELPIADYTDEAGNGLASSVVGLVVGANGRMRTKKSSGNPGSRSARRTHIITDPTTSDTWSAGEWAGYIESFGNDKDQAEYEAHKNRAGKVADKIASRLGHTNEYV